MPRITELLDPASDEPLTLSELERLVIEIAHSPETWGRLVDRACPERTYHSLHRDARVDIWAIVWKPGNDTGWHDHDTSSGAVHVVEGAITEHNLRVGGPERRELYTAGDTISFGPSHIHRLTCETGTAISIHAYSSPLWRLGQYSLDDDGTLYRVSVSYADELRPVELAAA
jgi:predicted metal-dependent enzyme (double-stranded beta helix superfamily)